MKKITYDLTNLLALACISFGVYIFGGLGPALIAGGAIALSLNIIGILLLRKA